MSYVNYMSKDMSYINCVSSVMNHLKSNNFFTVYKDEFET